jgi:hypothetical protein
MRDRVKATLDLRAKANEAPPPKARVSREKAIQNLKNQVQQYRKQGMKDSLIKSQMQVVLRGLDQETINQLFDV